MNSLQSGLILEMPLEKDPGFAYVKIIKARSNVMVKPLLMWSDSRRRGIGKWRMIGVAELTEGDQSVPVFNRTSGFW